MGALSWNSWEFLGISGNFLVFRTRVVIVGNFQSEFAVKIHLLFSGIPKSISQRFSAYTHRAFLW